MSIWICLLCHSVSLKVKQYLHPLICMTGDFFFNKGLFFSFYNTLYLRNTQNVNKSASIFRHTDHHIVKIYSGPEQINSWSVCCNNNNLLWLIVIHCEIIFVLFCFWAYKNIWFALKCRWTFCSWKNLCIILCQFTLSSFRA